MRLIDVSEYSLKGAEIYWIEYDYHSMYEHRKPLYEIPTVDAVPLDKLCEWLSESSINIPCTSCANFVNEYCTAIGDKSRPCPNSADDWRRAITEWMEEQDAKEKT